MSFKIFDGCPFMNLRKFNNGPPVRSVGSECIKNIFNARSPTNFIVFRVPDIEIEKFKESNSYEIKKIYD